MIVMDECRTGRDAVLHAEPVALPACRAVEERAVLAFVHDSAPPAVLLIEGEAGMGKSTLLGTGVAAALRASCTVLSVRPAESEAQMSFAGLADLLDPVADALLQRLEAPTRSVLEVILLRRLPTGVAPREREIGASVLAALRCLSTDTGLVLAVDDLQWLDRSSAEVLAFAVRRLRHEAVRVLLTRRTHGSYGEIPSESASLLLDAVTGLSPQVVTLGPLDEDELVGLVRSQLPGLSPQAERGLVATAAGNPYWALELGKALALGTPIGGAAPVPASLVALLAQKLAGQSGDVRLALVVVAALSRPTWGATTRALGGMVADPEAALDEAIGAGVVTESAGRLRPAHPLLGSAGLAGLTPGARRRLHRTLAGVSADPEQRARHLALSADGEPDSAVAGSLETGARSARSRGAVHAAAELAATAADLTPPAEVSQLSRRRLLAAELRFALGDLTGACELAEEMVAAEPADEDWPVLLPLLVESTYWVRGQPAAQVLLRAVLDRPAGDPRTRAVALACAADVGDGRGSERSTLATEAIALFDVLGDTDPGALSTALVYLAEDRLDSGHGMALDLLARAEDAERRHQLAQPLSVPVLNRVSSIRAYQQKLVDDLDGARTGLSYALSTARQEGDDGSMPALLGHLALTECWAGNYPQGIAAADEGLARAAESGGVAPASLFSARGLLAVHTGDPDTASRLIDEQLLAEGQGPPTKKTVAYQHVLGLAAMLSGELASALDHLERAWAAALALGICESGRRQRLEADLGQVLVSDGQLDRAVLLAQDQRRTGQRLNRPTLVGVGCRVEGLALAAQGDLEAAAVSLDLAVTAHRCSPLPLELPRSLLALGMVQRRLKAKPLARTSIREAADGFCALGAVPWQALADAELLRLDGPRAGATLTATEDRVATLAAQGHNNREIAAALFISPRTVEGHLATVYRKYGIRSRAHLPRPGGRPAA